MVGGLAGLKLGAPNVETRRATSLQAAGIGVAFKNLRKSVQSAFKKCAICVSDNYRDNARKQPPSAAIRRKAKQKIYEHQSAAHE